MRLPNGTGTISKLSGKRRKPYVAKKFVGWNVDDEKMTCKPIYKSIGTYATKREAMKALMEYTGNPTMQYTFERVYRLWANERYPRISEHLRTSYEGAFKYFKPLHRRNLAGLKTIDYETVITEDAVPRTMRRLCKIVLGAVYDYAMRHEIVNKDYSKLVEFHLDNKTAKTKKTFELDEIERLWERYNSGSADIVEKMILVQCYTGMRPGELTTILRENVHLEDHYMQGGIKTKAGKDRIIPIHPLVEPIIREAMNDGNTGLLFYVNGVECSYHTYNKYFIKLFPEHTPHECRHTFITYCDGKLTVAATDAIIGHSSGRLAEAVYTHFTPAMLYEQICRFSIP